MKTFNRCLLSVLFFTLTKFPVAYGQDQSTLISFENAYQMMQRQNPVLERARQQIKQKEYEKAAKSGLYAPKVSIGAKAVLMAEPLHLDLTEVKNAILPLYDALGNYGTFSGVPNPDPTTNAMLPTLPEELSTKAVRSQLLQGEQTIANANWDKVIQEEKFAAVTADFIWPIFTGGKIQAANKAANVEIEIGEENLNQVQGEMLVELVNRYYGLALATQAVEVRRKMYEAMDTHYSDAEKLYNEGMIAKIELLHANVVRNEAERELKKAQRNVQIIETGLSATLASDTASTLQPASNLFINKTLPAADYWISLSIATNPQLKQLEGKKKLIAIKDKAEKGEYLPTVAAIGSYNIADKNLSEFVPDWMVGVGMQWSIFEGLSRNKNIKATQAMEEQILQAESQAKNTLKAYLTKLHHQLSMDLEQIKELESTLELAEEYCASTEKAFKEGFATSTAVADANLKVEQAKILRLRVYYEYDITLGLLLQTAGVPNQYLNYCSGENTIIKTLN